MAFASTIPFAALPITRSRLFIGRKLLHVFFAGLLYRLAGIGKCLPYLFEIRLGCIPDSGGPFHTLIGQISKAIFARFFHCGNSILDFCRKLTVGLLLETAQDI